MKVTCMPISCQFLILAIYRKSLLFQFSGLCLHMQLPNLTGDQKGRISSWKNGHILLKSVALNLSFQDEGHLCAD